jgi:hypothetical protein
MAPSFSATRGLSGAVCAKAAAAEIKSAEKPARLELVLGELAHGRDDAPLLVGQLKAERLFGAHGRLT